MARWYQKWWGVILIAIGSISVLFAIVLSAMIFSYWRQIKQGKGGELAKKFNLSVENSGVAENRKELESSDDPYLGAGKYTAVVFIDYKCSASKEEWSVIKQVAERYGDKIKFIIRDLPFESLHPGATQLSEIASCADAQGGFWAMSDLLFDKQGELAANLSESEIKTITESVGLNYAKLDECLQTQKGKVEVNRDYADGFRFGITKTPTFFINAVKTEGNIQFDAWKKFLQKI
ncbi:MAG: DsbA family protein [Patescibacteria group bacterium]|nr:DsbA family protein [Patescibacteria group bacterium]